MNNFKPSELPAGTRIDDKVLGFWTKDSENAWFLDDPHCCDCSEVVLQGAPTPAEKEMVKGVYKYHDTPADEFFTDFKIICLPVAVVEYIVEEFAKMTGSEAVFEEALEAVRKTDHGEA